MLGEKIRKLTGDMLNYNTVTARIQIRNKRISVEAVFDDRKVKNSDNLSTYVDYTTPETAIYINSLNKRFDIHSDNDIKNALGECIPYLRERTYYDKNGKKPLDVYDIITKFDNIIQNSSDIMDLTISNYKIYDKGFEDVIPLIKFHGGRGSVSDMEGIVNTEFVINIGLKNGIPVAQVKNSMIKTDYDHTDFKPIQPNMVIPLVMAQYTQGYTTPKLEKLGLSYLRSEDLYRFFSILEFIKDSKITVKNNTNTKTVQFHINIDTKLDDKPLNYYSSIVGNEAQIFMRFNDKVYNNKLKLRDVTSKTLEMILATIGVSKDALDRNTIEQAGFDLNHVILGLDNILAKSPYKLSYHIDDMETAPEFKGLVHKSKHNYATFIKVETPNNTVLIASKAQHRLELAPKHTVIKTLKPVDSIVETNKLEEVKNNKLHYFLKDIFS